jgi:hypothetical protein
MADTSTGSTGCPTPGECQPTCDDPACFKAKLRTIRFSFPGPFRAQRGKTDR